MRTKFGWFICMLATLWWFVVTAGQYYWQSLDIITFVNANFFYVPGVWWLLFHNCVNQMELWNYRNKMKTVRLGFFLLAVSLFGCCWMTVGGQICALLGISIHISGFIRWQLLEHSASHSLLWWILKDVGPSWTTRFHWTRVVRRITNYKCTSIDNQSIHRLETFELQQWRYMCTREDSDIPRINDIILWGSTLIIK